MLKLQRSVRKCAVWNMFVDNCSFRRQVITTFYIFLQQSSNGLGATGFWQSTTIYKCITNRFGPIRCRKLQLLLHLTNTYYINLQQSTANRDQLRISTVYNFLRKFTTIYKCVPNRVLSHKKLQFVEHPVGPGLLQNFVESCSYLYK